jgi:hypothetical protein
VPCATGQTQQASVLRATILRINAVCERKTTATNKQVSEVTKRTKAQRATQRMCDNQ